MAQVTRRYLYKGPWPADLKLATDPALVLVSPRFAITYDVTFDDAVSDVASMDERMKHWGCFPDAQDTIAASPLPFLGIVSPDGQTWKLSVDNAGALTVIKVSQ